MCIIKMSTSIIILILFLKVKLDVYLQVVVLKKLMQV